MPGSGLMEALAGVRGEHRGSLPLGCLAAPAGLREVTLNGNCSGRSVLSSALVLTQALSVRNRIRLGLGRTGTAVGELGRWAGLASAPATLLGARRVQGGISLR